MSMTDTFQTRIATVDPNHGTDETLIEVVVSSWEFIAAENDRDRELVTVEQWNQWKSYQDYIGRELNGLLDRFKSTGELSESDKNILQRHLTEMSRVTRKSPEELRAKLPIEDTSEQVEQESTWKSRLRSFLAL